MSANVFPAVRPVVVGVDGSRSALDAVRWAAAEAARRDCPLRIVHVYQLPLSGYGSDYVDPVALDKSMRLAAQAMVRTATAAATTVAPELACTGEVIRGAPLTVLRTLSATCQLLVLGSRGIGGFVGLIAGSVAVGAAAHARCPVVVVRGDRHRDDAPVVVGVDGSSTSDQVVEAGFEAASLRGCPLVAVLAWNDAVLPVGPFGLDYPAPDWRPMMADAERTLAERLAGWQEKFPDVVVRRVVAADRPAQALRDAARDAQLLLVGSRGRGGFAGLLLGSVSQAMIHHSPCPVMVVRAEEPADDAAEGGAAEPAADGTDAG